MKLINTSHYPFTFDAGRKPDGTPIRHTVAPHGGAIVLSDDVYAKIKGGLAGNLKEVVPQGGTA